MSVKVFKSFKFSKVSTYLMFSILILSISNKNSKRAQDDIKVRYGNNEFDEIKRKNFKQKIEEFKEKIKLSPSVEKKLKKNDENIKKKNNVDNDIKTKTLNGSKDSVNQEIENNRQAYNDSRLSNGSKDSVNQGIENNRQAYNDSRLSNGSKDSVNQGIENNKRTKSDEFNTGKKNIKNVYEKKNKSSFVNKNYEQEAKVTTYDRKTKTPGSLKLNKNPDSKEYGKNNIKEEIKKIIDQFNNDMNNNENINAKNSFEIITKLFFELKKSIGKILKLSGNYNESNKIPSLINDLLDVNEKYDNLDLEKFIDDVLKKQLQKI